MKIKKEKEKKQETFASLIEEFKFKYDLSVVFDDFLTMSMCAVTQKVGTGKSYYEDLYLETVKKYAKDELRHNFPKMFANLILEMEEKVDVGGDVLGDYYEQHLAKKNISQFFTPWPICEFMAKITVGETERTDKPLRILEPACGSGRMLLASAKEVGPYNEFYGIDVDHVCVKMTVLNLFLNGVFNAEVMCGNALAIDDFRISYKLSMFPLGIFRIEEKEQSKLWHMMKKTLEAERKETAKQDKPKVDVKLPSESGEAQQGTVSQLQLF
jgi:type I restriction-modification system DNA methylase subunit